MNDAPRVSILNASTGQVIERELTEEELDAAPVPFTPLTPLDPE